MKKLCALTLTVAATITLFSAGCAQPEKPDTSPYFFSMAADAAFIIPKQIREEKEQDCYKLYGETRKLLNELDSSLSVSYENSHISKFNAASAGDKVEINKTSYDVLTLAKTLYEKTDGYYNPAVYYNVQAYGFGGAAAHPSTADELPSDEIIEKYNLLSASFAGLELQEEEGKYYAVKPAQTVEIDGVTYSVKLDLGGLGKGYAVDKVNALMDKYGINYGYFTFGESSIAFKKFNGTETDFYTLGLSSPRYESGKSRQYLHTKVKDVCISTSGDNVQYYEIDGTRYCHVIDPVTGKPVQTGIMSATVIGGSAAEADAFTTAIMAMGRERAVAFIQNELSDRKVTFTYDNGDFYEIVTNIPAEDFTVQDDRYTPVGVAEI